MKTKLFVAPFRWLLPLAILGCIGFLALGLHSFQSHNDPVRRPHVVVAEPMEIPAVSQPPSGPIRFVEIASTAGLDYRWKLAKHPTDILDGVGQGCAFLDINNDGNLDVLFVGPHPALFLGDGKGHFTNVTHAYGLDTLHGQFCGCCVGDYDNDGYDDIYLSGYRAGVLLHNVGGKHLVDVTQQMGLLCQRWGTSCAFVDVDGDGRLDLFVGNYVDFDPKIKPNCIRGGIELTCGPRDFNPLPPMLFHNEGKRFVDVTSAWKVASYGGSLGVACADYDNSGHDTIAVANDLRYGDLLHWDSSKSLSNWSAQAGVAGTMSGNPHAGMGIDWGDFDNDGRLDLVVTTFQNEPRSLYHNNGDGTFFDVAMMAGMENIYKDHLAFGVKFIDVDNDGWLDIMIANGHVQDNIAKFEPTSKFHQSLQLLHNSAEVHPHMRNISQEAGLEALPPIMGRGLAIGDFDNDGRMDALVSDADGTPQLLHNQSTPTGHWLLCRLVGTKSNRDGYGALLTFTVGGRKLLRRCGADGSYLSSSDKRVHVGLGQATHAEVSVHWPSGKVNVFKNLPADHILILTEK